MMWSHQWTALSADRICSPQAIELVAVSSNQETTAVCQDWMVERRGFEPMAIAGVVRSRAILACR